MVTNKFIITITFLIFLLECVSAQNIAFLPNNYLRLDEPVKKLVDTVQTHYANAGVDTKCFVYSLGTYSDYPLFNSSISSTPEQTADFLVFYDLDVYDSEDPKLHVGRDKNGIINSNLVVTPQVNVSYKVIKLATGEIVNAGVEYEKDALKWTKGGTNSISIAKSNDYFNGRHPDTLAKKSLSEYEDILDLIIENHEENIADVHFRKWRHVENVLSKTIYSVIQKENISISNFEIEKDKVDALKLPSSQIRSVFNGSSIETFTYDTIGNYVVSKKYGSYYRSSVSTGNFIRFKPNWFIKRKQLAIAINDNKKVYGSFIHQGDSKKLNDNREKKIIGVYPGRFRVSDIESKLATIPSIKLIDIEMAPVIQAFRKKYKQERFLDDYFTPKALGADYIVKIEGSQITLQDVKRGTLLHTFGAGEGAKGLIDGIRKPFDLEIEIVLATNKSKDKVKKVLLYSPISFTGGFHMLKMYEIIPEQVRGETKYREVEIGQVNAPNPKQNIEEFRVSKGEKELFKAIENGHEIIFRNRLIKFLGHEFK